MSETPDQSYKSTTDHDPYGYYAQLHQAGDVVWDAELKTWLLPSYQVCKDALRKDETNYMSYERVDGAHEFLYGGLRALSGIGGPEHQRLHEWFVRTFSPTRAQRWADEIITPIVNRAIDRFIARGKAELCEDFANYVPIRVIAAVMGLPWQDDAWITECKKLNDDVVEFFTRRMGLTRDGNQEEHDRVIAASSAASQRLNELLDPFVRERRSGTGDDVISMLWRDGPQLLDHWTAADLIANVRLIFLGGSDTTTYAISNAAYMLLADHTLWPRIRQGGERAAAVFVEEVLRLYCPVHFRSRKVVADANAGGVALAEGEAIIPLIAAANRDPDRYPVPNDVDLDRDRPRDHLTFNFGPRACVGAALARIEVLRAVSGLMERIPDMRLDPSAEPPAFKGWLMRCYRPIHVTFAPAG